MDGQLDIIYAPQTSTRLITTCKKTALLGKTHAFQCANYLLLVKSPHYLKLVLLVILNFTGSEAYNYLLDFLVDRRRLPFIYCLPAHWPKSAGQWAQSITVQ